MWLCLALGLFVWLKLCLAWDLSVCASEQVMFGMGFVCLSVCASVQVMFDMGFVCSKHSSLIVFGIFGSPEKD